MITHTDATIAKSLLLLFQNYLKAFLQSGPTDLTIYAENFAAKLMEVYYGYSFINMNYASKNFAGIDLLNKEHNHGIQFTAQDNSSDKIINTIEKSNHLAFITVFFFTAKKVDTVVNHVKEKGKWEDKVEVISLVDIFNSIEQDLSKAAQYKELCELWINGETSHYFDINNRFNSETEKRIKANIRSKKYIPEIYIPEIHLKKQCRNFVEPVFAYQSLLEKLPTYYTGFCHSFIKKAKVELKDGTILTYSDNCDVSELIRQKYPEINMPQIVDRIRNYMRLAYGIETARNLTDLNNQEITIDEKHSYYSNGIRFTLEEDLQMYDCSTKKFFFIVKDAGQGKTNFLCDFCINVLKKRNIPTIFINVNELTKGLLDTVFEYISLVIGRDTQSSLRIIEQFCAATNKKLIICVDGLNERDDLPYFKNEVLELFRFADTHNYIKVLATSRNKAYETFFKCFRNESFGDLIEENIEKDVDIHRRKTPEFEEKLYSKYCQYFNMLCYISTEARSKLTNDTLLLRLFCEVYENNATAVVDDIYLYVLFEIYIKKRASQLVSAGKIKREEDLFSLLRKIAIMMTSSYHIDGFTYDGFSPDEKDLLDIIVQEDIIIKTSENNGISLFGDRIMFSFTYDEFRDFLLASIILTFDSSRFEKELDYICNNSERYDGVLKYLFLICKSKGSEFIHFFEKQPIYPEIYTKNIFSIEDQFLLDEDVKKIRNGLKERNEWAYYQVSKRLNLTHFKRLSVLDILEIYEECFYNDPNWNSMFVKYGYDDYYYFNKEHGLLSELLKIKHGDTHEDEVFGILALLSTITVYSESKEAYLIWLKKRYPEQYIKALTEISKNRHLYDEVQSMLGNEE